MAVGNDGPGSWVVLDRRVEEVIAKAKGEYITR